MDNVYLSALRLVNLGPWGDETIQFTEGLNVIVGPNGAGKSALFSSVRIALLGYKMSADDRRDAIHKGCDRAQIFFLFNDNSVYRVIITEKDIIYNYCSDITESNIFRLANVEDLEGLKIKLGSLVQGDLICNMIEMDKEKFLIDTRDDDNYGIISFIINDEDLDKLIDNLENYRIPRIKSLNDNIARDLTYYQNLMNEFSKVDLTNMKSKYENASRLLTKLDYLIQSEEYLGSVSEFKSIPKKYERLLYYCGSLDLCLNDLDLVNEFIDVSDEDFNKLNLASKLDVIVDELSNVVNVPCTSKLESMLETVIDLDSSLVLFNDLRKIPNYEKYLDKMELVYFLDGISSGVSDVLSKGDVQTNLDYCIEQLNEEAGEIYDSCPVYGKIKFANGECVPCD